MLDKQKQDQYSKFKDSIFGLNHSNTEHSSVSEPLQDLDPDTILDRARLFIHRIKDHWHDKIKRKQIDKFKCLHYKICGYHHNITRHNPHLDNIDRNDSGLRGQPNVPSSIPPRSSTPTITSTGPATPHPPHLLPAKCQHPQLKLTLPAATLPTLIHVEHHWTNGSSIYPTLPFPANNCPYYKKVPIFPSLPSTPLRSLHHGH